VEVSVLSEWPGGLSGGDYDKRNVAIDEPRISLEGLYVCPVCDQKFVTRQDYDDHYVNVHTCEKVKRNYTTKPM